MMGLHFIYKVFDMLSWFKGNSNSPVQYNFDCLISEECKVDSAGVLFKNGLHVDGEIKTDIKSVTKNSVLRVSKTGRVEGSVTADFVLINGRVIGDIVAKETVEVAKNGSVSGNIYCKKFKGDRQKVTNGKVVER